MSQSTETTRPDPLVDAYHQASVREGARAGANVRAAVLAHARVVAQSSGATVAASGLTDATRATPAANEPRPIWRLAAGVVIGLVGVWIFQLTRPSAAPDTAVAVASLPTAPTTPQADKARAAEPAKASAAAPAAAAAPEATVAVAAPPVAQVSAAKPASAARERQPEAALPEQNLAMAKVLAAKEKTDRPAAFATDTSAGAMSNEVIIASAEMRKSAKVGSRAQPATAALAIPASPPVAASPAAPTAFPAQVSEVIVAAAPAPLPAPAVAVASAAAAAAAPAIITAPWRAGASGASGAMAARGEAAPVDAASAVASPKLSTQMNDAARVTLLSDADLAMFRAVRAGDIAALRSAIARGVNVNAKDERGRTSLHIARERADVEAIKVLETAGAR